MATIKLLDTHTINKIAAGEVVERPSSVVKELVENSIDAKASTITVEIKNGGIDFIRVTDNGCGIDKDQVEIAFLRHATSKITSADDLLEVMSLGFRGEALASIGAVSKVELITKTPGVLTGKRVAVHGGKLLESEEIACPEGTTLMIRQLFYNVPARKAFLKSTSTETSRIADSMYKLALAHPEVSFKYIQNNKLIFTTSGNNELKQCVFHLYGKETAKNVIPIYYEANGIEVVGLIGNPSITRGNRHYEHFFINGRYVKSYTLQKATEDAYKTLVTIGKFPFVIIHVNVHPDTVDVNVHPTKLEVRFKDQDSIYQTVYDSITAHLQEQNLIPQAIKPPVKSAPVVNQTKEALQQVRVESFLTPHKAPQIFNPSTFSEAPKKTIREPEKVRAHLFTSQPIKSVSSHETVLDTISVEISKQEEPIVCETPVPIQAVSASTQTIMELSVDSLPPAKKEHLDYKIVGQLFNTYWMIEYMNQLFIIDQHAAHERVMYENYMRDFANASVSSQLLLSPETFHVSASEREWINTHLDVFSKLGFILELFGENHILIREVPYLFNKPMPITAVKQLIDTLQDTPIQSLYEIKESDIIQMSCKSAIKAHDQLDAIECKALIEALLNLENPFTCPHGRPTIVSLTKNDIEKIFKRIQ